VNTAAKLSTLEAAADLAVTVQERYRRHLLEDSAPHPWASNRASGLGDACERRIVLWRTRGNEAAPISEGTAGIFEAGKMYEGPVLRMLEGLGIALEGGGVSFPPNAYQITGHLDRLARWLGRVFPVEFKTTNPHTFEQIREPSDLANHRAPFVRKWYDQVQVYMLLADVEAALLILWDKLGGRVKALAIPFDASRAEFLTDRAARVNAHVEAGTVPDFCEDRTECARCPFLGRACAPPVESGPGAVVLGIEVEQSLGVMEANREAAEAYETAEKRFKDLARGVTLGLAGDFIVTGKWRGGARFEIPKDVKEQYRKDDPEFAWLTKWERLPATGRTA
jgi:hypothetical protein